MSHIFSLLFQTLLLMPPLLFQQPLQFLRIILQHSGKFLRFLQLLLKRLNCSHHCRNFSLPCPHRCFNLLQLVLKLGLCLYRLTSLSCPPARTICRRSRRNCRRNSRPRVSWGRRIGSRSYVMVCRRSSRLIIMMYVSVDKIAKSFKRIPLDRPGRGRPADTGRGCIITDGMDPFMARGDPLNNISAAAFGIWLKTGRKDSGIRMTGHLSPDQIC